MRGIQNGFCFFSLNEFFFFHKKINFCFKSPPPPFFSLSSKAEINKKNRKKKRKSYWWNYWETQAIGNYSSDDDYYDYDTQWIIKVWDFKIQTIHTFLNQEAWWNHHKQRHENLSNNECRHFPEITVLSWLVLGKKFSQVPTLPDPILALEYPTIHSHWIRKKKNKISSLIHLEIFNTYMINIEESPCHSG